MLEPDSRGLDPAIHPSTKTLAKGDGCPGSTLAIAVAIARPGMTIIATMTRWKPYRLNRNSTGQVTMPGKTVISTVNPTMMKKNGSTFHAT
jgi:hypothetical protein